MITHEGTVEERMSDVTIVINLFANGLVREVNTRLSERRALMKVDEMRYRLNSLLFENDAVLMSDLKEKLQILVNMFGLVCERKKKKVKIKKIMGCALISRKEILVRSNGELLKVVDCFRYLGIGKHQIVGGKIK